MSESFAELFEESLKDLDVARGSTITGTVVSIDSDWITVNAGLKSEGIIAREEFLNERGELEVNEGDEVEVAVDAIDDGTPQPQVYQEETTVFAGNEGLWFLKGFVFFSTKSDNNVWAIDTVGGTIESIYNPEDGPVGSPVDPDEPPLTGVDNLAMTLDGEMIVVEDGGDMRAMVLLPVGRAGQAQ